MTELHEEVLSPQTTRVFECLGHSPTLRGLYLAGGTGLALQLGHRLSADLDLFTERPWAWELLSPGLSACGPVMIDRQEQGTFVGAVSGVRVSVFHYPYVLLEEPVATRFRIPVASLLDIGCMKLVAVAQRGSKKDFIDIHQLGQAGISVRELLRALNRKMPGVEHNPVHVLRSLAYFEDAEAEPDPIMLVGYDWGVVREYCLAQATGLLDEITG